MTDRRSYTVLEYELLSVERDKLAFDLHHQKEVYAGAVLTVNRLTDERDALKAELVIAQREWGKYAEIANVGNAEIMRLEADNERLQTKYRGLEQLFEGARESERQSRADNERLRAEVARDALKAELDERNERANFTLRDIVPGAMKIVIDERDALKAEAGRDLDRMHAWRTQIERLREELSTERLAFSSQLTELREAAEACTQAWADYTSQEMYGEMLREGMGETESNGELSDFDRWEEAHDKLRAVLAKVTP